MKQPDLVVGLDSSTQSAKAVAFTRDGTAIAEGRAPIAMSNPHPGWMEQEPDDWWGSACAALSSLTSEIDAARVAGVAVSNQRETIALFDADLNSLRPGILWLDERAREDIAIVSDALGADVLHSVTGKHPDLTPVIYRLNWLKRHEPDVISRASKILDVHGYLTGRLTGTPMASWTSADPSGVFNIVEKTWSKPLLDYLGLEPDHFATLVPPGSPVGRVTEAAAAATGLLAGTPVAAAGGDGQCAGLGVNAIQPGVVYVNLGTAIITGAWSEDPRIARHWRTMTSPTGEGYFLEGCQRAGTFFVDWFLDTCAGGRGDGSIFGQLEMQASKLPIGSEGVTICPYLSGCMDPHWDPDARAAFIGLAPHHRTAHLYRAVLEGLTLEISRCIAEMQNEGLSPQRIIALGGGAASPLWRRMLADATGLRLSVSGSLEASAAGAAMCAAKMAGWFASVSIAAEAMCTDGESTEPNPAVRSAWDLLSKKQSLAYRPQPRNAPDLGGGTVSVK